MLTKNHRGKEAQVSLNMQQANEYHLNQVPETLEPTPDSNQSVGDEESSSNPILQELSSQNSISSDFVKPELPEFLRSLGPGISPLKENPPVSLSWHNVRVKAPPQESAIKRKIKQCLHKEPEKPKELLKGVSGIVQAGEMCSIMGASGAGKTTLMNVLTHRRTGKLHIDADVRINGRTVKKDISGMSGFAQQEELFIGALTVREHLRFHSMLRLGKEFTNEERANRVNEVLRFLNLTKAEKTVIGIPGIVKGLSGGEKRRLTVATEILSDPPLLFCDEPTTGLDSSMAFILLQAMRKLADQGKTIVCTIHQPSSEIFFLFDKLYLLAEGQLAYFGSIEQSVSFFRQFGLQVPRNYNPADYYIQQLAIHPRTREENLAQVEKICNGYRGSPQYAFYLSEIESLHAVEAENENSFFVQVITRCCHNKQDAERKETDVKDEKVSRYKTSSFVQFRWLLWRNIVNMLKNPFEIRLRMILSVFLGVLIGLLYFRIPYDRNAVQNFNALIFLLIINTSFSNIFAVTQSYTKEYPIFYKDHDDAVYRVTPFYFAKFVVEIPLIIVSTFIQILITYWISNLYASAKRFFIFLGIILLISLTSIGLGSLLSVLADTPEHAQAMQIPILLPLMVFGGFFLNNKSGQVWLNWLKYISWFYYGNEALIINQWDDVHNQTCEGSAKNSSCYLDQDAILALVGFDKSNFGRDIGIIIVLWFAVRLLAYGVLAYKARFHK